MSEVDAPDATFGQIAKEAGEKSPVEPVRILFASIVGERTKTSKLAVMASTQTSRRVAER